MCGDTLSAEGSKAPTKGRARDGSLRDWADEQTAFAGEIDEAALAHLVGNKVERAYRRSDALEKRRRLMEARSEFIEGADTP